MRCSNVQLHNWLAATRLALILAVACHVRATKDVAGPKHELQLAVGAGVLGRSLVKEITFEREKELEEDYHATMNAFTERFHREQARRQEALAVDASRAARTEKLVVSSEISGCEGKLSSKPVKRENLLVLPAGDSFDASKWMTDPMQSSWDIILIYFGKNRDFRCPLCKAVYRASGPKWRLIWGFTLLPEWQDYQKNYTAIMFPDDDLTLDLCTINTVFYLMKTYTLLAAQPSLCDAPWSFTPWKILYQQSQNILRFTTMIEIMAPTFDMDYFQNFIRPSLHNAHVGWGLDFIWPYLLHYPRDKIAVIDQVCMMHPPSTPNKANSVYNADAPYRKKEEETRRFAEYMYYESEIERLGFYYMAVEVVGVIPKPVTKESLLIASSKTVQTKLIHLYPLLLVLQSMVIVFGAALMLKSRVKGRWRLLELRLSNKDREGKSGADSTHVVQIPAYWHDAVPKQALKLEGVVRDSC